MKRLLLIMLAACAIGFTGVTSTLAYAQKPAKSGQKMGGDSDKKDNRVSNVWACKTCKLYYPSNFAKGMHYKDKMGHKLVHMDKAPVGYRDASKKSSSKM